MKKILALFAVFALSFTALSAEEKILELGKDYEIVDGKFGSKLFKIDGNTIYYAKGSKNNNHFVLFKFTDTSILKAGTVIQIDLKFDKLDTKKDVQLVIQPSSVQSADYGKQSYPVIYNSKEPSENPSFTVDVDNLLNSSVKNDLAGFRMLNNEGRYEKYVWQSDYQFTITKVTLKSK